MGPATSPRGTGLPPGQRATDGFPRFGAHLHRAAPAVPEDPEIEIAGAVAEPFAVALADFATLPRRELIADLHCVSGWSTTNLKWEGVGFEAFYRQIIEPKLRQGDAVTHVVFAGLDGYRSIALLSDALADDVIIAEHLGGAPLDDDHGAPIRLVSPSQYGYISTKHLCRIELHTHEPSRKYHSAHVLQLGLQLLRPHPRARVWMEERHGHLPAWLVRPVYRLLIRPIAFLSARGSTTRNQGHPASR